jgi:sulfur carrier protein ThiS
METRVHVHGFLKHVVSPRFPNQPISLEFEPPLTVYKILSGTMGIKTLDATVLVNGRTVNMEYVIQDGDEIHILSPIAGG